MIVDKAILRCREVVKYCGLSRATIERRVREGEFPKPIPLGGKSKGWLVEEINEWLQSQVNARDAR